MIIMSRIENGFVFQLGVGPFKLRYNIARNERPQFTCDVRSK